MKRLGQHFLRDKSALKKIVKALDLRGDDIVVEIGAGHGELTEQIQNAKIKNQNGGGESKIKIIAIEKDGKLAGPLKEKFSLNKNIEVVNGDALRILQNIFHFKFSSLHSRKFEYKLAGNIPYYITGKLLRILSELEVRPDVSVFTVQKEVAERICARAPRNNRLAAITQFWAKPEIICFLPPGAFSPPPEVDSAIIKLKIKNQNAKLIEAEKYYKAVKVLFAQPRKTILNNLAARIKNKELRIKLCDELKLICVNPKDRPQNLSVEQIIQIGSLI